MELTTYLDWHFHLFSSFIIQLRIIWSAQFLLLSPFFFFFLSFFSTTMSSFSRVTVLLTLSCNNGIFSLPFERFLFISGMSWHGIARYSKRRYFSIHSVFRASQNFLLLGLFNIRCQLYPNCLDTAVSTDFLKLVPALGYPFPFRRRFDWLS